MSEGTPSSMERSLRRAGIPPWARRIAVWLASVGGVSAIAAGLAAMSPQIGAGLRFLCDRPAVAMALVALAGTAATVVGLGWWVYVCWQRIDALHLARLEDAAERERLAMEHAVARAQADAIQGEGMMAMARACESLGSDVRTLRERIDRHLGEYHADSPATMSHPAARNDALDPLPTTILPFPSDSFRTAPTRPATPRIAMEHA